jgi:S-adenosylmethionine uptake transporter
MFALSIVITRQLRQTHWMALVAYQTAGSGLIGGVLCTVGWVTPGLGDIGLMFTVGIVSMGCFMCITKALAMAPASLLAPLQYSSIVWAVLLGWLIWGDTPTPTIMLGIFIIVGSGLSVFSRKRQETESQPAVSSG